MFPFKTSLCFIYPFMSVNCNKLKQCYTLFYYAQTWFVQSDSKVLMANFKGVFFKRTSIFV